MKEQQWSERLFTFIVIMAFAGTSKDSPPLAVLHPDAPGSITPSSPAMFSLSSVENSYSPAA